MTHQLRSLGLHDAEITGIDSLRDIREVLIRTRLSNGNLLNLKFKTVHLFRVVDFGMQNVISRVLVYSKDELKSDIGIDKINWLNSFSDTKASLSKNQLDALYSVIDNDDLNLVYLEPSCGAELAILFSESDVV